ncbi:MAG: hypothetical protein PHF72_11810 [Gammaproteobacteria bacterium]|nr:hypothetical protein [Gammaproteobacteria bacterium]
MIAAALAPIDRLDDYDFDPAARAAIDHARGLVAGTGGGRLTTSFLLMAMVDLAESDPAHPLRFLAEAVLHPEPWAYRGVTAAYAGWFRGSNRPAAGEQPRPAVADALAPYVPGTLELARRLAAGTGAGAIGPEHLLAALLGYRPDDESGIQPGAQYLLSQCTPGPAAIAAGLRAALGPQAPAVWDAVLETAAGEP